MTQKYYFYFKVALFLFQDMAVCVIGLKDGSNFYWQYETSRERNVKAISFRGSQEERVQFEFDNFVKTIPERDIIDLRPMLLIDLQWCAIVIFRENQQPK